MNLYYISDRIYPSGNAGGIRIDYITRMFSFLYDVSVIAFNNKSKTNYINKINSKIKVYILSLESGRLIRKFLDRYIFSGIQASKIINSILVRNSTVVIYSTNIIFVLFVLCALRRKSNVKIIFDVVENFGPNNFKFGVLNPKYFLFRILYNFIYCRGDGVYAISKSIRTDFVKKGVPSFILPPLFSSTEFNNQKDYSLEIKNFIYSGNPFGKENLELMFAVLTILLERGNTLCLHLAGISIMDLNKYINFEKKYPLLRKNTIIYGWLPLSDLYKIYEKMHFTFFLRDNIQSNVCNFPMKLVEMMNYGIIPVISNVGDYAEALDDNLNAFLIDKNCESICFEKFIQILNKSTSELFNISKNARSSSKNYDYLVFYEKYKSELISFTDIK